MEHAVRTFIVPKMEPGAAPRPGPPLSVAATTLDAARASARERLEAEGYYVRTLTFGPTGLVAYVEERAP